LNELSVETAQVKDDILAALEEDPNTNMYKLYKRLKEQGYKVGELSSFKRIFTNSKRELEESR